MDLAWKPSLEELNREWLIIFGDKTKGKVDGGVDLECYRTVLLKAFDPFRIELNFLNKVYNKVPRANEHDDLRVIRYFEQRWYVSFPRGGTVVNFRSSPVVAPVSELLPIGAISSRERLKALGVINLTVNLASGNDEIIGSLDRLRKIYAINKNDRSSDVGVGEVLGLPGDEVETNPVDLGLIYHYSEWLNFREIREKIRFYENDSGVLNRKNDLLRLIDPRGHSLMWLKFRDPGRKRSTIATKSARVAAEAAVISGLGFMKPSVNSKDPILDLLPSKPHAKVASPWLSPPSKTSKSQIKKRKRYEEI